MAVYAIGDIQGCYTQLRSLLDRIRFDPEHDQLWFCGDLVNRGMQSLETLRFVSRLGGRAIAVLGNHDLHLLAVAEGLASQKRRDHLDPVLEAPDRDELLHWLRHRPLLHHDVDTGFTLIHAGLPPQWDLETAMQCARELETALRGPDYRDFLRHMYGNEPAQWSDSLNGIDRLRFITNCFTRLRYCSTEGVLHLKSSGPPGTQPESFLPWYEVPTRASAKMKIVFGHWSTLTLNPPTVPGVFPLDTGCVWGRTLTAMELETQTHFRVACPEGLSREG